MIDSVFSKNLQRMQYALLAIVFCAHIGIAQASEIDAIKARGKLLVGVCTNEQKPFYYKDKNGKLVGTDIEIAYLIAHEIGVEPEFVQDRDTWDAVVQDVVNERTDIALSYISVTPQRSMIVMFSTPYMEVRPIFMMNRSLLAKAALGHLTTLNQVFGNPDYRLYTPGGSAYTEMAKKLFKKTYALIYEANDDDSAIDMVLNERAACYFTDEVDVATHLMEHPEYKMQIIAYPMGGYTDSIAIPVSYKNQVLLSLINSIIETRDVHYTTEDVIAILQSGEDVGVNE